MSTAAVKITGKGTRPLPIGKVFPNPDQPRKNFDQEKLEELADNIQQYGLLEPIVVTPRKSGFMIIAGERRWRACNIAGLDKITASVIRANKAMVEELALIENLHRADLNPVEEGQAFQSLLDRGLTVEELANKLGMKQPWRIRERTALLNLGKDFQQMVVDKTLTHSQATEMSRVPKEQQMIIFRKIRDGELDTYNKLRAFVDGLLKIGQTESMFEEEEITQEHKEILTRYEKTLDLLIKAVSAGFNDNEIVILKKMLRPNLQVNLQKIDLIASHMDKLKNHLQREIMEQKAFECV